MLYLAHSVIRDQKIQECNLIKVMSSMIYLGVPILLIQLLMLVPIRVSLLRYSMRMIFLFPLVVILVPLYLQVHHPK